MNQAGYPAAAPKRAHLLAPAVEPGATFVLVRARVDAAGGWWDAGDYLRLGPSS